MNRASSRLRLVVVDSRSNQWEELSKDLPDNTDLLVLDDNRGGVNQLKDFLGTQGSDSAYTQISLIGSADGDVISFGSEDFDAGELGAQISLIQQSELVADDVNLQLYAAPFVGANAVSVTILDPAPELLEVARDSLKEASLNGTLKLAANAAFTEDKFDQIDIRLNQFLTGESAPSIEWADFEADFVRGAYLTGESKILLNRSLAKNHSTLENVLLEEFGHWLDDVTSEDSLGDEGAVFAAFWLVMDHNALLKMTNTK